MKLINSRIFSGVTVATLMSGLPLTAQADDHEGMDVPMISTSIVLEGLENPWDMAFLPDGTMFFTEKCSYVDNT